MGSNEFDFECNVDENVLNNEFTLTKSDIDDFELQWSNFNGADVLRELKLHKQRLLIIVRKELMELVVENARNGVSVFSSREYPKYSGTSEANPYSKLNEDDIKEIINEFRIKGINVKTNVFSRDTVKFQFKLLQD